MHKNYSDVLYTIRNGYMLGHLRSDHFERNENTNA